MAITTYSTGTISLTNGSAVVTGTGTGWQTALIVGGVICPEAPGNPLPIASVNSNTSITATTKWTGATGTYAYTIARQDDVNQVLRNAQALSEYVQRLDSDALEAIASLDPADNTIPFFSAGGTAGLLSIDSVMGGGVRLATRASAAVLTVPAGTQYLRTEGYAASGDGGGALYRPVASEPQHPGKVLTADGKWWELSSDDIDPRMLGAKGDGAADDAQAIRNAIAVWAKKASTGRRARLVGSPGNYKIATTVDFSAYFPTGNTYNLEVDLGSGFIWQIAAAINPGVRFGPPDGGSFAFGKFNLGSFNGNGLSAYCLRLSNVVDSSILIGSVGGYTGGVGIIAKSTGATGCVLNNDIRIDALLSGGYGFLAQDDGNFAYAFQGNKLTIGHCTSHTSWGVILQGLSSSNTVEILSLEDNAGGIIDQAGYNRYSINFAHGDTVVLTTANGRVDVQGYGFTMSNIGNAKGYVKDNKASVSPVVPTLPGSEVPYQNSFQRPATMTVSGGSVNYIAVDDINLIVKAGSFRVPYGSIVKISYASGSPPQWVWTFE